MAVRRLCRKLKLSVAGAPKAKELGSKDVHQDSKAAIKDTREAILGRKVANLAHKVANMARKGLILVGKAKVSVEQEAKQAVTHVADLQRNEWQTPRANLQWSMSLAAIGVAVVASTTVACTGATHSALLASRIGRWPLGCGRTTFFRTGTADFVNMVSCT